MQQLIIEHYIRSVLILLLLYPCLLYGDEKVEDRSFIDSTHDDISDKILDITRGLDEYFSDGKFRELKNESQLKLSMLMEIRESIHPEFTPEVNFRMVLPRTQKRLQLVVEPSDSDERSSTYDSQQGRRNQSNNSSTNAGLRYIIDATGVKFSAGSGVVVGIPTRVFTRGTASKTMEFGDWTFRVNEELYWVNTQGLRSDLDADFYKQVTKKLEFKFVNNIHWDQEEEIIEFEHGPSFFQDINDESGLSYHAHIFFVNKPNLEVENYLLQVTYTTNIYKRWIFANFTPFINFPRLNDFQREPGFNIRFDALFGYFQ